MKKFKNGWYKRNNGSNALLEVVGVHESGDVLCRWAFDEGNPMRYHPFEFSKEFETVTQEYVDNIERQCCPERYSADKKISNPDRWDVDELGVRDCSFCGSIHPDDLITLIKEQGFGIINPSDKNYKWYIDSKEKRYKYYRYHDSQHDFVNKYNKLLDDSK